jgi:putative hemolysin
MTTINLEIAILFTLAMVNGVFAMSEIALLSARRVRLERLSHTSVRARAALQLLEQPNNFLSTVQIGVTLVGVLSGAFGGATLAEEIAERLESTPVLAPYAETIGVAVVVIGITYLSLVVGELVPKRVALRWPERMAIAVAPFMRSLSRVAFGS